MPLCAVLATTVAWTALCMFLFCLVNQPREKEIPLRLHGAGSSEQLVNRSQCPEIIVREDDQVEFDGVLCDHGLSRQLPQLRKKIQTHIIKPDAAKIVVFVEAEARYERMIDVLNALTASKCGRYHVVILPPFTGPKVPYVREPESLPEQLMGRLRLGF
jgi:biopolymer transport protein ExbD